MSCCEHFTVLDQGLPDFEVAGIWALRTMKGLRQSPCTKPGGVKYMKQGALLATPGGEPTGQFGKKINQQHRLEHQGK